MRCLVALGLSCLVVGVGGVVSPMPPRPLIIRVRGATPDELVLCSGWLFLEDGIILAWGRMDELGS